MSILKVLVPIIILFPISKSTICTSQALSTNCIYHQPIVNVCLPQGGCRCVDNCATCNTTYYKVTTLESYEYNIYSTDYLFTNCESCGLDKCEGCEKGNGGSIQCTDCVDLYRPSDLGDQCVKRDCDADFTQCEECNTLITDCIKCNAGYLLYSKTPEMDCLTCPPKCSTAGCTPTSTTCTCNTGTSYEFPCKSCLTEKAHCSECNINSHQSCTACDPGYEVDDGDCLKIGCDIPECEYCLSPNVCNTCTGSRSLFVNACVQDCPMFSANQTLVGTPTVRCGCPDGHLYFYDNNTCLLGCLGDGRCDNCGEEGICVGCKTGYMPNIKIGFSSSQCLLIDCDYRLNMIGCLECEILPDSNYECTKCAESKYLDTKERAKCKECPNGCSCDGSKVVTGCAEAETINLPPQPIIEEEEGNSNNKGKGALIWGIVGGVVVIGIIIGFSIWYCISKRRERDQITVVDTYGVHTPPDTPAKPFTIRKILDPEVDTFEKGSEFSEDNTCSICLEEVDAQMLHPLPCQHSCFHAKCIKGWIRQHFSCPLCRSPVTHVWLRRYAIAIAKS